MPAPIRLLLGSSRRLLGAVVLFIVLDLSVLLINLWIAQWVAMDAVAINLAGRQRMLSQSITKSAMLASGVLPGHNRAADLAELSEAHHLFANTLRAFEQGGVATGSTGQTEVLTRLNQARARQSVMRALELIAPLQTHMDVLWRTHDLSDQALAEVRDYMVTHNRDILHLMNDLTSVLEQDSVRRIGTLRWVQTAAFVLAIVNFVFIVWGLVRQKRQVEQEGLAWQQAAQHDPLTGLYNRMAFGRRLEQALDKARNTGTSVAVMVLDLDDFKPVNDQHGHAAGDAVLQALAKALLSVARESDTVARLGGDEFAVFCPNLHSPLALTDFCERLFAKFEQIQIDMDQPTRVQASLGVAVFPTDGSDTSALLRAADAAMYLSKQQGGRRYSMAEPPRAP